VDRPKPALSSNGQYKRPVLHSLFIFLRYFPPSQKGLNYKNHEGNIEEENNDNVVFKRKKSTKTLGKRVVIKGRGVL
jgi:hypothetical protein